MPLAARARPRPRRVSRLVRWLALSAAVAAAAPAPALAITSEPPELVSETAAGEAGNGASGVYGLAISADGGSVAFSSAASNLVEGDGNLSPDVFVRRLADGSTVLASANAAGEPGDALSTRPSLSSDGERVAFLSASGNLHPSDANGRFDAFVKELSTGELTLVSSASDGDPANAATSAVALSADGRKAAFVSRATNLAAADQDEISDVYVKDLETGSVELASVAADGARPASEYGAGGVSLSADGARVAFATDAALDERDTNARSDVYVKDLSTGGVYLASATADGRSADAGSTDPVLTADGEVVVFSSFAADLDPADGDEESDIYSRRLPTGRLSLVSTDAAGQKGNGSSSMPAVSGDGRVVAFASYATNLAGGLGPDQRQLRIFVKDPARRSLAVASGTGSDVPAGVVALNAVLPFDGSSVAFATNAPGLSPADINNIADVYISRLLLGPRSSGCRVRRPPPA